MEQDAREEELAYEEDRHPTSTSSRLSGSKSRLAKQRQERLRDMIEPKGHAARGNPILRFTKLERGRRRWRRRDHNAKLPLKSHEPGRERGGEQRGHDPADGLGGAKQRPAIEKPAPPSSGRARRSPSSFLGENGRSVGHGQRGSRAPGAEEGCMNVLQLPQARGLIHSRRPARLSAAPVEMNACGKGRVWRNSPRPSFQALRPAHGDRNKEALRPRRPRKGLRSRCSPPSASVTC